MSSRKFCVLSPGRSGSTALMDALRGCPDIVVPPHNAELLSPRMQSRFMSYGQELAGRPMTSQTDLLRTFFGAHAAAAYVGFKLIPMQYERFVEFSGQRDVQFILLYRRDIASLVASWFVARKYDSFSLGSRQVVKSIAFGTDSEEDVRANLRRVMRNVELMDRIDGAIRIEYEDLCGESFESRELEQFLGREIRLSNPRGATDARDYVENWQEFSGFIETEMRQLRSRDPAVSARRSAALTA